MTYAKAPSIPHIWGIEGAFAYILRPLGRKAGGGSAFRRKNSVMLRPLEAGIGILALRLFAPISPDLGIQGPKSDLTT